MSHARQVFRGATVAVVLKCSESRFFLRPGGWVNRTIRFLLGHYASKHGIQLHGFAFMGNHFHLVLTDTRRLLPRFMEEFDSMLARVLNCRLRRAGRFWEATPYRSWRLKTPEELLQHLVYVAANPVEAYVVRSPGRWPGVVSLPSQVGTRTRTAPPPGGLFGRGSGGSSLPDESHLEVHLPPLFDDLQRFRRLFQAALDAYLKELHARPGTYAGRQSARNLDPFSAPKSAAGGPSFSLIPALTNATREDRLELKAWRRAAREAYHAWRANKSFPFPVGSWQAVVRYGAPMAPD